MIAKMQTRVPGPKSKELHPTRITWSDKIEKTNIWDVDGNRFLDLTSGGGVLPFGYVDEGMVDLSEVKGDFLGYHPRHFEASQFEGKRVLFVGAKIESPFFEVNQDTFVDMLGLSEHDGTDIDLLWVRAEFIEPVALRNIQSWCDTFSVNWVADERDLGLFRTAKPFASAEFQPDYILTTVATEKFAHHELVCTRELETNAEVESIPVAANYADEDLARTISLQSMELSEMIKDCVFDRDLGCVGSFHSIDMRSSEEAERVLYGLLQRGVIVAKMHSKIILLPSLYLALGEIIFAVNHIKLVVEDINEMSTDWMSEDLRD